MSSIKNLILKQDNFSLNIPEWQFEDNGIIALSGPSGSGKTTVFRCLLGLEKCESLSWMFNGLEMNNLSIQDKNIGVVFQTLDLFPHMSIRENIEFPLVVRNFKCNEYKKRFDQIVESLKISKILDQNALKVSGGEKQRAAIARAIIFNPRFLFLDEPFSSLDEELKSDSRKLIKSIIEQLKIPTLMISHDPYDIQELAQQVFKIKNGSLV